MRGPITTTKLTPHTWVDDRLAADPELRKRVDQRLAEMRLEQELVRLRAASHLSQAQVGRVLGVTQPAIARIESGSTRNLTLRTLFRLVAALGGEVAITIRPSALAVEIGGTPTARQVATRGGRVSRGATVSRGAKVSHRGFVVERGVTTTKARITRPKAARPVAGGL